mgnify:CR=1 FL=1
MRIVGVECAHGVGKQIAFRRGLAVEYASVVQISSVWLMDSR